MSSHEVPQSFEREELDFKKRSLEEMLYNSRTFYELMKSRRSVRSFSGEPVPKAVLENCLRVAGSAPSGANRQPWHFCVIRNLEVRRQIRQEAEKVEHRFYHNSSTEEWRKALKPLGTDEFKPYLEEAPCLIAIFAKGFEDENLAKNYYPVESTGLAAGFLITALHNAGLATLTHTPSPMRFLNQILKLPQYYRPFLLLVTGYPGADAHVPKIVKKPLESFVDFVD